MMRFMPWPMLLRTSKLVAGGGAPEIELALRLREYAATLKGREQLAVTKFAEAVEIVPKTLAENAGFDAIDKVAELKNKHEKNKNMGLNAYTGEVEDMYNLGVVEPLRVKIQAILSATDAACLILRIDDVLASTKKPPARGTGRHASRNGWHGRNGWHAGMAEWAECRRGCSEPPNPEIFFYLIFDNKSLLPDGRCSWPFVFDHHGLTEMTALEEHESLYR